MKIKLTLILSILTLAAHAQVKFIGALSGSASYVKAQNPGTDFLPIVRPSAGVITYIPLAERFGVQLGAGFSARGYNTSQQQQFNATDRDAFTTRVRLNYLSLPLLLSYNVYTTPKGKWWVDGGMNYDLFLLGRVSYVFDEYRGQENVKHVSYKNKVSGVFSPTKYGSTTNTYDVNGLDVAVKLQVRYEWKKYSAAVYYQQSLYDMRVNTGDDATAFIKSRGAGLTIGYTLF